jgi:subtilisin family serine protease
VQRLASPVAVTARPPVNGSTLPTTHVPGPASLAGAAAASTTTTYTNPWRYCPGDIQLGVSDGEGCDEWWLAASYVDSGVTHYGMNAVGVWSKTMGQGVTIGLLSTGADTNDPDYADNLAPGGYNYVDGNTDTNDTYGTGTVLTGVMAAEANNGGFVGVAPKAKVLEVKVLGPYGTLTDSAASQGITYAVSHGASVIAFPLYEIGPGTSYLPTTQTTLSDPANQNVVFALASGDLGSTTAGVTNGPPNDNISPDGSKLPNTITVASEDYLNNFDQFTDSGPNVQIVAPGTSLLGDYPDNWPSGGWISGSQSAASEVAAVAALLRSVYPTATATQVVQAIIAGGRPLSSLQGLVSCSCMLDASGALAQLTQTMGSATQVTYQAPASALTPTSPTYDNGSGAFWGDCSIPNTGLTDPRANCQWYVPQTYNETGYYGGTHYGMNLAAVWPQTTGVGVQVATVDTGAAPNPDFSSQLVPGYNFWDSNGDTTDVVYHGTYTASLIAAQPNNGLGIAGVAPGATLMPVKVLGPNEEWDNTKILTGLNYAVNTPGVKAVNISLAGLNSPMPGIQNAMQNAQNKSVLLVFAAGNWGADHDNPAYAPTFDGTGFDNVLTVAASTHWNTIAFFSDYGPQHVDIAAPGEGIAMDTIDGSDSATSYGTSFAAPLVTGVAALLFSEYPQATAAQVKEAICDGARQIPAIMTKVRCGLLDAEGALQALGTILDGPPAPASSTAPTTDAGSALTVGQTIDATTGSWTNSPASYTYQWQVSANGASGWSNASGAGATTPTYTVAAADVGNYLQVTVTATNPAGSASASSAPTSAVLPLAPAGGVPTIAGTAKVGQVLTASPGTWSNSPTSFGYQWQRSTNGTSWTSPSGSGATTSSYTIAAADAGSYLRVTVTATNAGGSASASSSPTATTVVANDTTPPTVSVTAPRAGSSISASTTLTASASDNVGVARVEFYVDGKLIATDTASPYTTTWNPATVALGTHSITAKAYDQAGNSTTSAAVSIKVTDTTVPSVSITSPAGGSSVTHSSTVSVAATATDNRAVSKVLFYVNNVLKCTDTTASYTCNWAVPSQKGVKYTVTVRAYDSSNNTASTSVTVTSK